MPEDCVDPLCTSTILRLNASTLSSPNSLLLKLKTQKISQEFLALVDSGSSHCFIETDFVCQHSLSTFEVDPLPLSLFNGTVNSIITKAVSLPVRFPTGEVLQVTFYVMPLDSTCSVILRHNWLTCYNPMIDWVLGFVTFRKTGQESFMNSSSACALKLEDWTLKSLLKSLLKKLLLWCLQKSQYLLSVLPHSLELQSSRDLKSLVLTSLPPH